MDEEGSSQGVYEIYKTESGVTLITSSIKINIMRELKNDNLTLADLSRSLNISQSTLVTNLSKMVKNELIKTESDPVDNRKIYYTICSRKLISSKEPNPESEIMARGILEIAKPNRSDFHKYLLMYIIMMADSVGIDSSPSFEYVGRAVAESMEEELKSEMVESLIIKIKTFFKETGLGEISVFTFVPLTIIIQKEYKISKETANTLSKFTHGFFIVALKQHTGRDYHVTSSETFGDDTKMTKFTLDVVPTKM